jgi:uncharacterized protein YecE (DUF72 family)
MAEGHDKILTGCCGFALAQATYFRTFRCVEIDTTFYQLPQLTTAAKWRASAPDGFHFAMKAWQPITHPATSPSYKRTRIDPRDRPHCGGFGFNPTIRWAWNETFAVAKELGAFFVLFQCPSGFRQTKENIAGLRRFFERAKRGKFLFGWEPRGPWEPATISALCRELDLVHVVDPLVATPLSTGNLRYFRMHGIGGRSHRYTDEELRKLQNACRGSSSAYCFFNNIGMARDAQRFATITAR